MWDERLQKPGVSLASVNQLTLGLDNVNSECEGKRSLSEDWVNKSEKLHVMKYWQPLSSSHISHTQHCMAANKQGCTSHVRFPAIWQDSEKCLKLGGILGKTGVWVCVCKSFVSENKCVDRQLGGGGKRWALPLRGGGFRPYTLFFDAWQVLHCARVSFRVTEARVEIVGRYRELILYFFYPAIPSFGLTAVHQPFSILFFWRPLLVTTNKLPVCPSAPHLNATVNVDI